MKVTNEKTENSQVYLTVEMEPEEVEESLDKAYKRLVKKTRIPGFRQGKAPRPILERHIGRSGLLEEALNELLPEAYEKAIEEQKIETFTQPQIEVIQTDPLAFKAVVPLKPEIKLGDYKSIRIEPQPVEEVTEENVDNVVEQLRHQHATWEPVERPVDFGDLVVMDISSEVEGEDFLKQEKAQFQIIKEATYPVPGFSEELAGMKGNDEKEFTSQLPEDYPREEFAGKEAKFKIKVHEIKQEILPELNDSFATQVNEECKTMDELRGKAETEMKARAEEKAKIEYEEKVVNAFVDIAEIEFPSILVDTEVDRIFEQRFQNNTMEKEIYLKSVNKTEEEAREELHPVADERIKKALILGKLAEEEKIEVEDSDIHSEMDEILENTVENKAEVEKRLQTQEVHESLERRLLTRKTIDRLIEISKGSKIIIEKEKEEK